jgi:hypothetical protein
MASNSVDTTIGGTVPTLLVEFFGNSGTEPLATKINPRAVREGADLLDP